MDALNEFRIEKCFISRAGPVWICRQIYECHEDQEQIDANIPIAFWRNDLPLKNEERSPGYYVCWRGTGSRTSGVYLMLFMPTFLPWIGNYSAITHMDPVELQEDRTGRVQREFDPEKARCGQTFAGREVIPLNRFLEMYEGVQRQLVTAGTA